MARSGTALDRHHDPPAGAAPWRAAVTERMAGALARREPRTPTPDATPVSGRLLAAFELRLTRVVERRLGGGDRRTAGALEQRLVAVLSRRLPGAQPDEPAGGPFARLARRRAARDRLPATRVTTLRALVVSLLARGLVRALVRFVQLLTRGFLGAPIRRIVRALARRTLRARAPRQAAGFLALLLALIALCRRFLGDRLGDLPQLRWGGALLVLRLLRTAFAVLRRPAAVLLRALARLLLAAIARRVTGLRRPTS
jgi:hypothetical protein